jgi:hypothetical protein
MQLEQVAVIAGLAEFRALAVSAAFQILAVVAGDAQNQSLERNPASRLQFRCAFRFHAFRFSAPGRSAWSFGWPLWLS